MMPVWELRPTADTTIRPDPSITWVPEGQAKSQNPWREQKEKWFVKKTNKQTYKQSMDQKLTHYFLKKVFAGQVHIFTMADYIQS